MSEVLRLGTRGSALALAQSRQFAQSLGVPFELVRIRSHGDVDRTSALTQIGGTGVFVTAVREALLEGRVDLVVHSMKDLPTAPCEGVSLACVPAREDPRDALCSGDGYTLDSLPQGASVGTGSPRRAAQILACRPDLDVRAVRGNVDTRLALTYDGPLDAVVLAAAGLNRVGRADAISELLSPEVMLPAPAQGALAVESCAEAHLPAQVCEALAHLDDAATRAATLAERLTLRILEAGCAAPVAAWARMEGAELVLEALVTSPDGKTVLRERGIGSPADPEKLARDTCARLFARGAREVLAEAL
ncbi:hydroxymethylbilane synthase [Dermabacteraceae bacterium P13264]